MVLILFFLVSVCQLGLYIVSDRNQLNFGRSVIFLVTILSHFFFFPRFFYPEPDPNGVNCGMPILGITLAFWIFGGGASVITHILYMLFAKPVMEEVDDPNVLDVICRKAK